MELTATGAVWWVLSVVLTAGLVRTQNVPKCGGQLNQQNGVITSPSYPDSYPNNQQCEWTITAKANDVIDIRFSRLDLEGTVSEVSWIGETCPDFVKVYDGETQNSPLIYTLCRTKNQSELTQLIIRSTNNKMHVVFFSDYEGQRPGFVASYWTHVCPPFTYGSEACNISCGCVQENTASCNSTNGNCICKTGWRSPDCSQDVDECLNPRVEPCPLDYRQCVNTAGSYECVCKNGLIESYDSGDCVVDSASTCGEENECSHLCVNISRDNAAEVHCYCPVNKELVEDSCQTCSNVAFGNDCRLRCSCWPANTQSCDVATGGCICLPGWTSSDCSQDIDECTELRGSVCPSPAEQCVNTRGGYECRCRSGSPKSPSGSCEGCSYTLTNASGIIQSPNFPASTYDNVRCNWTIIAPVRGATILLSLSQVDLGTWDQYRTYCYYDALELYDGNSSDAALLGQFCGYYSDTVNVQSSGNMMYLAFRTNTIHWTRRFNGAYSVREYQAFKSNLTAPSGIIASPGYPVSYQFNVFSTWTVTVSQDHVVTFSFADYQLGACGRDYVEVYDGSHAGVELIARFCDYNLPRTISSTARSMYIVHSSDSTTSERGFNGSYITDACKCIWSYTESCNSSTGPCVCKTGYTGVSCDYDINECQENPCPPHSQCLNSHGSFSCVCWNGTRVETSGLCNDWQEVLTNPSGEIHSQNYPDFYPKSVNYTWTIHGKSNTVVSLRCSDFDVETYDKCYYDDAVEVYDVLGPNNRLIGQYCGKDFPNLLRTTGPDMLITFMTNEYTWLRGYKGFNCSYISHVCPLFTYGEESCSSLCSCVYDTTQVCDNTNGVCFCKSGWVGRGCSQDLDECLNPDVCPANSECFNQPGNYYCECRSGYVMDKDTGQCNESSSCSAKMKQTCSHLCDVDPLTGQEACFCPDGLVLLKDKVTCIVPLYPYGMEAADIKIGLDNFVSPQPDGLLELSSLIPVGKNLTSTVNVFRNGVITFKAGKIRIIPHLNETQKNKRYLIAPFWTENRNSSAGEVYYHVYETCGPSVFSEPFFGGGPSPREQEVVARVTRDVKLFYSLPAFEVNVVVVVTWKDVQTKGCKNTFTNTFQAVIVSGRIPGTAETYLEAEERTYAIFIYQDGDGICKPGQPFEVGISTDIGVKTLQMDRNSPKLTQVNGNTGFKGVITFEVGKQLTQGLKCQRYLCKHADLISNQYFQSEIEELYKCPCSLDRLGLQWQFVKEEENTQCYAISPVAKRRLLKNNQRNRLCCYSWTPPESDSWEDWQESWLAGSFIPSGHILIADPWSSSSFGNAHSFQDAQENMQAKAWCCGNSPYKFCNRFHKLFGDLQCTTHPTFVPASALGDPDIKTLDGFSYLMNGAREYVMLDIPSQRFTLQTRTERVEINRTLSNGTVFTAFAAQEGTDAKFQVQLSSSKTSMVILANGMDFTNKFYSDKRFTWTNSSVSVTRWNENRRIFVVASFSCGVSIKVHVGSRNLEIDVEVIGDLKNETRGLLGNFNDDPTDDFLLPNGTVLSANITERQICEVFATSYLVTKDTSVFTYEEGESTENYQHPEFIPVFLDEADPVQTSEAENVCGNDNKACIIDYLATRDEGFAKNTKKGTEMIEQRAQRLNNNPPKIRLATEADNNGWIVHEGKENIATFVAEDEDKDNVTCELVEITEGVLLHHEGTITYTPDRHSPIHLRVRARDSKGEYSSILSWPIKVCPHCSKRGTCNVNGTLAQFLDGQFQILTCTCFPAYEGDNCELEIDACKLSPCSVGQNCTDLTAAEQGNSSVGYRCGPCPAGTIDVNGLCEGVDECADIAPCDQECVDTYRSYQCSCQQGFRLNPTDKRTCNDINECEEKTSVCEQICDNTIGSYTCACRNGNTLSSDGRTCIIGPKVSCQQCEQGCTISNNEAVCDCNLGYRIVDSDPNKCSDIDECNIDGMSPCSQICSNTLGKFECSCFSGFSLDIDGVSCLECESPNFGDNCSSTCDCRGRGTCDKGRGCDCDVQWSGTNCDKDVNECADSNACSAGLICRNELGSFSCDCPYGHRMENGACLDIDECSDYTNKCDLSVEVCYNIIGNYTCRCKDGYTRNQKTGVCEDVNECESRSDNCEHICENGPGSFKCACNLGYQLAADRCKCEKYKDTCNLKCNHGCSVDSNGTHTCICPRGYRKTGTDSCEDINECLSEDNLCDHKDRCVNTPGGYNCSCEAGYRLENDGKTCTACSSGTWGAECANSCACGIGATSCLADTGCRCKPGYTGVHCTDIIDRCASGEVTCPPTEECVISGGNSICQCRKGYAWNNGQCQDENECQTSHHKCEHICTNTEGSYNCSCYRGYNYNSTTNNCNDINECENDGLHNCDQICKNTAGSFICSCHTGFSFDSSTNKCYDENECSDSRKHNCDQICTNTEGSFSCSCLPGYYYNSTDNKCYDVNECETAGLHNCQQTCNNTAGSFDCSCWSGYLYNQATNSCHDVNECLDTTEHNCDQICTNREGSFTCSCHPGYNYNSAANNCYDVDECQTAGLHNCEQVCTNTEGSFECSCFGGYRYDLSTNTCHDIDECQKVELHNCQQVCTNTVGGFDCSCFSGYLFTPATNTCHDVDECQTAGLHNCEQVCTNTEGSFECSCFGGYRYDLSTNTCHDVNECLDATKHNCDQVCTNSEGSFTCSCYHGYQYNASVNICYDIDECQQGNPCSNITKCRNLEGSFECLCWNRLRVAADGTCKDCNRTLNEKTGYLMSSNHPGLYPSNSHCSWTIKVNDSDALIVLSFLDYDLEGCPFDYIRIHNGDSQSAPSKLMCSWPKPVTSKGNSLHIVFTSDFGINKSGFLATYTSYLPCKEKACSHTCSVISSSPRTEECQCPEWMKLDHTNDSHCVTANALKSSESVVPFRLNCCEVKKLRAQSECLYCNTVITEPTGYLVSPNYPEKYPANSNCHWTIQGPQNSIITISFADFALESSSQCRYDYVRIHDGNSESAQQLGNFCGKTVPTNVTSSGNNMYITFKSNAFFRYQGFRIVYIIHEQWMEKSEARAVIKFQMLQEKTRTDIHREMEPVFHESCPSYASGKDLCRQFTCGHSKVADLGDRSQNK